MQLEDIALTMVPGLGIKGIVHLLECFGSAADIYSRPLRDLVHQARLREDVARNVYTHETLGRAEKEMNYCRKHHILPVASTDPEYPQIMRETPDYPHVIYVNGSLDVFSKHTLTMVGTREATTYGRQMCNDLVRDLGERIPDLCIVSGLAFGIDAAVHRACLDYDVQTVAVVANALPSVTPVEHAALADDIVARGGAVITELHSQTKQNGSLFITRNRIMAALGYGTLVVESGASGGSLATVNFADGYNRTVMAVPGRVTDRSSRGTNMLIRNRKAQLVLSADDIVSEMMWDFDLPSKPVFTDKSREIYDSLLPVEKELLECFGDSDTLSVNDLAIQSGLNIGDLSAHLMSMEISGAVRQLPGNIYEKLLHAE